MEYEAELLADFREFYGVGLYEVSPREAAALVSQLPASSRSYCAIYPEMKWPIDTKMFLSRIEYELAILLYRDTKDAKYKKNKPEQILPPSIKKMAEKQNTETSVIKGYSMPVQELDKIFRVKSK